jgi:predicted ABC-type sugar transport system permease subunit
MLFLIIIVGEEVLGETGEKISTVVGALIIALAHVRNFKACRDKNCNPPKK